MILSLGKCNQFSNALTLNNRGEVTENFRLGGSSEGISWSLNHSTNVDIEAKAGFSVDGGNIVVNQKILVLCWSTGTKCSVNAESTYLGGKEDDHGIENIEKT